MRYLKFAVFGLLAAGTTAGFVATPASAQALKVSVDGVESGKMMPAKYGFCMPAAQGHVAPGPDISPHISWSKGPAGTKSYAIILHDTDSPAEQREKMNKEGETLTSAVPVLLLPSEVRVTRHRSVSVPTAPACASRNRRCKGN